MTIDLTAAAVRPAGGDGLASRTAAGFVALGSDDAAPLLEFVDQHQTDPDLIEQLAGRVAAENPRALALLFTAGGDPWLLAWGAAVASIAAPTMRFTVTPVAGEVLVHRLPVDADARIVLSDGALSGEPETAPINLAEGSMPAGAVVIDLTEPAVGAAPSVSASTLPDAPVDAPSPGAGIGEQPPTAPTIEPPRPTVPPAPTSAASPSVAPPAFDVPFAEPAPAPDAESGDGGPGQPAAQGIVFADDLEEISDLIDEPPSIPEGGLTSITFAPAEPVVDTPAPSAFLNATRQPSAVEPVPAPPVPPVLTPASEPDGSATIGPELVLGISCPNAHHNHPEAAFCTTCGARMGNDDTTVLVNGPRPPLGVLVADDGSTWSIESDMVFGRDPHGDHDVRGGSAVAVPLADDTVSMSRRHARVRLDDWAVSLTDLGSSNGTWLRRGGDVADWIQITAENQVELESGDEIRLGGRSLQVELHHRS